jgi:hypothetical protein
LPVVRRYTSLVIKILSVLRSGGDFRPSHAARLFDQVMRHAPHDEVDFLCLTDQKDALDVLCVPAVPLTTSWPGWFAKIEALAAEGPALYFDLDVNIIADLTPLLEAATMFDFIAPRDFWVGGPHRMNSSVMAWSGSVRHVYDQFAADPDGAIKRYQKNYVASGGWGDQGFIWDARRGDVTFWDDIGPGLVMSYKRGALEGRDLSDCAILCSHGEPRPWSTGGADEWLKARAML